MAIRQVQVVMYRPGRSPVALPRTRAAAANQASQRGEPWATARQWGLTWAQRQGRRSHAYQPCWVCILASLPLAAI